jgi:preprotein translocase subunit SecA
MFLAPLTPLRRSIDASGVVNEVLARALHWSNAPDQELLGAGQELSFRARSAESPEELMPEAFALVCAASQRVLGMQPYDVQVEAATHLSRRCIVEMDTGEGKTLAATMPLYLFGLTGKGVLLATANDYLAQRDAEQMSPLFEALGLTVGVVQTEDKDSRRRAAYACDITYGTANQFAFDLLRDRAKRRHIARLRHAGDTEAAAQASQPVARSHLHAMIVDEADSLLIDEATMPLVIATPPPPMEERLAAFYRWASYHAPSAEEGCEYRYDTRTERVELTHPGQRWVRALEKPIELHQAGMIESYEQIERAIKVHRDFQLDDNYVLQDGQVIIVDEQTGRLGPSREWQDGIHQAIQAKEGLTITMPYGQLARITIQSFFLAFGHLSGMTGTAHQSASEFRKVYELNVVAVPTHRPLQRRQLSTKSFLTEREKAAAVCEEVRQVLGDGRAVLIGTRTIDASLRLSAALDAAGIEHEVLNAYHTAREAELVARAGRRGKVTVATNMAGRGTDIKLDSTVRDAGGLHVIATEIHESKRIDRQLVGRCGRQGDPGTYRQYLCLEDEVLELGFGVDEAQRLRRRARLSANDFVRAQRRITKKRETKRYTMLHNEKERLKSLWRSGLDPLLDVVS